MRDDISFVTLSDTFKPDDASSLSSKQTERSWSTVFAEAVRVPHESDLPVAQAVDIDAEVVEPAVQAAVKQDFSASTVYRCNFVVITIGYAHLIFAVSAAFGTELMAVMLYLVGSLFYSMADNFQKSFGVWALPLQTMFLMVTSLLLSLDLLVLTF